MMTRMTILGAGILLCWGASGTCALQVNSDPPNTVQNEVSVTLNSVPPSSATGANLVMVYNDFAPSGAIGVGYSLDSGLSWSSTRLSIPNDPAGRPLGFIFDPISGADTQGNVFAGYIAAGGVASGAPSGLFVERSTDGGVTWSAGPTQVAFNSTSTPGPYRFNDKPHMEVDTSASSSYKDHVYVGWIQDDGVNPQSDILFAHSADSGQTFGSTVTVNDNPGTDMANGPNIATAANGTVYVAWTDVNVLLPGSKQATLMIDRSTDGGVTFGTDVSVLSITSLPNNLTTASGAADARARSYPAIATDPNDATGQTVYMVYAADPDGATGPDEGDVYFIKSTDGGQTWTAPIRLNNDSTTNDQFAPWIAVKPNGTIDVVWYDKRNSPQDDKWDVYMAVSLDGGNSFLPNQRVTGASYSAPPASGGTWLGEYLGLAVDANTAYIGYTATYTETAGDIFFDSMTNPSAIPEPLSLLTWSLLGIAFGLGGCFRRRFPASIHGY